MANVTVTRNLLQALLKRGGDVTMLKRLLLLLMLYDVMFCHGNVYDVAILLVFLTLLKDVLC